MVPQTFGFLGFCLEVQFVFRLLIMLIPVAGFGVPIVENSVLTFSDGS